MVSSCLRGRMGQRRPEFRARNRGPTAARLLIPLGNRSRCRCLNQASLTTPQPRWKSFTICEANSGCSAALRFLGRHQRQGQAISWLSKKASPASTWQLPLSSLLLSQACPPSHERSRSLGGHWLQSSQSGWPMAGDWQVTQRCDRRRRRLAITAAVATLERMNVKLRVCHSTTVTPSSVDSGPPPAGRSRSSRNQSAHRDAASKGAAHPDGGEVTQLLETRRPGVVRRIVGVTTHLLHVARDINDREVHRVAFAETILS